MQRSLTIRMFLIDFTLASGGGDSSGGEGREPATRLSASLRHLSSRSFEPGAGGRMERGEQMPLRTMFEYEGPAYCNRHLILSYLLSFLTAPMVQCVSPICMFSYCFSWLQDLKTNHLT